MILVSLMKKAYFVPVNLAIINMKITQFAKNAIKNAHSVLEVMKISVVNVKIISFLILIMNAVVKVIKHM